MKDKRNADIETLSTATYYIFYGTDNIEITPDTCEDDGVAYISYRWLDPTNLTLEIAESEGDGTD